VQVTSTNTSAEVLLLLRLAPVGVAVPGSWVAATSTVVVYCLAGCQAPSMSQLLRYLLHLYSQHTSAANISSGSSRSGGRSSQQQLQLQQQAQQLVASKGGKVAQGLLLEGRDEGPLPPDVSGQQLRSTDVQVGIGRLSKQQQQQHPGCLQAAAH
jgi:hypothetical protein